MNAPSAGITAEATDKWTFNLKICAPPMRLLASAGFVTIFAGG